MSDIFPNFARFKMKSITKTILFALTAVLLFASMLQKCFNWPRFRMLKGVVVEENAPELTFRNCCDGTYQQQVEPYLKQHCGCREPLIRLYNQYLWDFYGETKVAGKQIMFGKDLWIYEPWVVANYYQWQFHSYASDSAAMARMLSDEAQRVFELQEILDSYGIKLFVCLVPSKDLIYPEYLPENWETRYDDEPKITSRFFNEEEYTRLGVNHLNLEQYFLQMKDTVDFALFPQTGIHWSKYASLYAADTLIRYMEHLGDINIPNIVIGPRELDKARDPDDDLESLMNLIRPLPKPKCYYANVTADGDTTAKKPKIIVVGDSFWWNVATQLPLKDIFTEAEYWYYNSSVYYYPPYESVSELNREEELLTSDFVILFYSASTQYRMNDRFTQQSLELFNYIDSHSFDTAAFIEQETQRVIGSILASPDWADLVREKASKNGIDFDQALYDDAQWAVYHDIKEGKIEWPTPEEERKIDTATFVEREVQRVINSILASPEWANVVREKAAKSGISFDQALHDDALWVVNRDIEEGKIKWPVLKQKN